MDGEPPAHAIDWQGKDWTPGWRRRQGGAPQQPLHRADVAMPGDRSGLGRPEGRADRRLHLRRPPQHHGAARLPGASTGRSASTSAATMGSEMTAAAFGQLGEVRRDPFAMLPFCGYNMGDYFSHWLDFGRRRSTNAAADLQRQLVPQRQGRQVPLARLRREHARAEVDRRPRPRQAPPASHARLDAALRGPRLAGPRLRPARATSWSRASTPPPGARSSSCTTSCSASSRTICRASCPRCGSAWPRVWPLDGAPAAPAALAVPP